MWRIGQLDRLSAVIALAATVGGLVSGCAAYVAPAPVVVAPRPVVVAPVAPVVVAPAPVFWGGVRVR